MALEDPAGGLAVSELATWWRFGSPGPSGASPTGISGAGPRPGRGSRRTGGAARCGRRGRSAAPRSWHPGDHACAPRADRRSATGWRPCHHAHRRCRHVRARRPCPRATARAAGRASGHARRASGPGPPAPVVRALPRCRGYGGLVDAGSARKPSRVVEGAGRVDRHGSSHRARFHSSHCASIPPASLPLMPGRPTGTHTGLPPPSPTWPEPSVRRPRCQPAHPSTDGLTLAPHKTTATLARVRW
jgi:hypothetical protein